MDQKKLSDLPLAVDLTKTVLVTGGAGFIGKALIKRILAEDTSTCVLVIDNNSTGSVKDLMAELDQRVMDPRREHPLRTIVIEGNITDVRAYQAVIGTAKQAKLPPIREIYHLACPASPVAYNDRPIDTTLTAVMGTWQTLLFADQVVPMIWPELPPPRMVHASTSEVYGDYEPPFPLHATPDEVSKAIPESYRGSVAFRGPRACYDEGKRCAETLVHDFMRLSRKGLDVRTARLFNVYGPGMRPDDGRVMSAFICAALRNEDLKVCGDGQQTRSLTYVDDTVKGLMDLMAVQENPGPVNLGDPRGEITMLGLAMTVIDSIVGCTSQPRYVPARVDEPRYRVPDVTLALATLGWNPKVELVDGIALTIEYLKTEMVRVAAVKDREELERAKPKEEKGRILLDS